MSLLKTSNSSFVISLWTPLGVLDPRYRLALRDRHDHDPPYRLANYRLLIDIEYDNP